MRFNLWRTILVISSLLAMLAARVPAAWAQTDDVGNQPVPARLSVAEGQVYFWRSGDQDWSPAQLNMALEAGDAIYAGSDASVEIQVGPRAFLRLMANTEISIVRHDAGLLQVSLKSGDASLDARSQPQNPLTEIDTPNAAFSIDRIGYYRVAFRDDTTRFFVRRNGLATLGLRDGYQRTIADGDQIIVRGSEELTVEAAPAPPPDSWDRWNDARSDYYDRAASNRYLPADVYGAADLDQYGTWNDEPTYGMVWFPTVTAGWAPYTVGVWHWDPFYEWTWVDAAPWGWAPCHYGRWVHIGGRWAWAPGPRISRPVYLPAVVGFLGFGSGPTVGWVALGWGEPVIPWWGHRDMRGRPYWGGWGGPRIVNDRVVERHASIDVNAIRFQNSQVSRAVVTVQRDQFGRDHDRRYRFATAQDGRPTPIQGGLPVLRRERSPATVAPVLPALRTAPSAVPGVREAVPPARGSVTVVPSARMPATREERRVEPQLPMTEPQREQRREQRIEAPQSAPAPRVVPRPMISHPPQPEVQPRIIEPRSAPPVERRDERPALERRPIDVAPQPHRTITVPQAAPSAPLRGSISPVIPHQEHPRHAPEQGQAPAPAREMQAAPVPRAVEPRNREESRRGGRREGAEGADQRRAP